jgi:hypothetical protein
MFGQIGFVKWGKGDHPVLILNPYYIPPGPVRDQWISMYKKVRALWLVGAIVCLSVCGFFGEVF